MNGNLEEELYREQLKREQERARREQAKDVGKELAKAQAKKAAKKAVKKGAERVAASGAASAAAAAWSAFLAALPWILIALGVIALILIIVFLVITTITAACNPNSLKGRLAKFAVNVGTFGQVSHVCSAFEGFQPIVARIDQGEIPETPKFEVCPNVPRPPLVDRVECDGCVDIRNVAPTVEIKNNSKAKPVSANIIRDLQTDDRAEDKFKVTEAFCPTTEHQSHDHYNGYAIDIDLVDRLTNSDGTPRQPQDVVDVFNALKEKGEFRSLLCEYPADIVDGCTGASANATAWHIHFVPSHPH